MSSNENNKRIAKNTLMLYFRMLFTMGVSLYTSRVILNTLGIEDFGIYNVVGGIVALFGFLNSTLSQGTRRFLTFHLGQHNFKELQKTFSVALILHIFFALIILLIGETIGLWFLKNKINIPTGREYAAWWVYQFSLFASMISIIQVPFNAIIIAHERMNVYAYVSIIEVSLKLLVVYLLSISGYDKLITYALLVIIVQVIIMIIYSIYCKKKYDECRFCIVSDKMMYKSMCAFSGWFIFNQGGYFSATQGTNILLNMFFGTAVNAARGIAFQVNMALLAFVNNFLTALEPNIVKLYALGKKEELFTLVFQSAKFAFCMMWLLVLPFLLKIDTILRIWLINVPEYTDLFCRLILIQSLFSCMLRPFFMVIFATGKVKRVCLITGITYLTILPISYILLKIGFPAYIPFIVFIIVYIINFSYDIIYLHKIVNLSIERFIKKMIIPTVSIVICTLPISMVINYYSKDDLFSLFFVAIVSVLLVSVSVYFIAFSQDMRIKILNRILRRNY
jgi:O-antigen/teichoic acid export membrane protein